MAEDANAADEERLMNEIHRFTSDQKLKFWGYGEWIEEPDEVTFQHNGIDCKIVRMAAPDGSNGEHMFGGHLCGYIRIPEDSPYYQKHYDDVPIEAHGGLTYGRMDCIDAGYWIGFDCSHCDDYMPSLQYLKKTLPALIEIEKRSQERIKRFNLQDSLILRNSYKNIAFCIGECKSMADQLLVLK